MMKGSRDKLHASLRECSVHADVLTSALEALPGSFVAADMASMGTAMLRSLDQLAYRFMKLQDSLGEKVLPGLLTATLDPLPPEATFAERLQRLERLGALPSAQDWKLLREVRNSLAHEYPDHPDLQAALLNRLLAGVRQLLTVWTTASAFAATRLPA